MGKKRLARGVRRWWRGGPLLVLVVAVALAAAPLTAGGGKGGVRVVNDPELADLLGEMAKPLLKAATLPPGSVEFHVILDGSLNAVALPNLHVAFNSGLVLAVESPDELAGVMAHELGHLAAGHHEQLQSAAKGIAIASLVAAAAGLAYGVASGRGEVAEAAVVGSQAAGMSSILGFARQRESQSDTLAVGYLARAGFDPGGMAAFMERVNRRMRLTNRPPPYLSTHPLSSRRVEEAQDLARRTPRQGSAPAGLALRLTRIQAKLEAGTSDTPAAAVALFTKRLRHQGDDLPTRYGLAVAQRYAGALAQSEQGLDGLLRELPGDPFILRERALTRLERDDLAGAERDLKAGLQRKPHNPDLTYWLAFVLHQGGRDGEATRLLHRLTTDHPDEPRGQLLLGKVEGGLGNGAESHLALARYNRLVMDHEAALHHFREAVGALAAGTPRRRVVEGEYRRFREELAERERFFGFGRPR